MLDAIYLTDCVMDCCALNLLIRMLHCVRVSVCLALFVTPVATNSQLVIFRRAVVQILFRLHSLRPSRLFCLSNKSLFKGMYVLLFYTVCPILKGGTVSVPPQQRWCYYGLCCRAENSHFPVPVSVIKFCIVISCCSVPRQHHTTSLTLSSAPKARPLLCQCPLEHVREGRWCRTLI